MDLVSSIRKSGSRGGVNFNWEDVASSAHRENYLGHSLKAPVGRWQKGRDLTWYAKNEDGSAGPSDETEEERAARLRQEELKRVKEAEEDAMARALGLPPPVRNQTGANAVELDKPRIGPQTGPNEDADADADADAKTQRRHEDSERGHRRRQRSRSRDRERDRRRDRSPRRRDEHDSRRAKEDRHHRERRREHGREKDADRPSRRHHDGDLRRHDRRRRSYSRDRDDDRPRRSHRRDRSRSPRGEPPADRHRP